MKESEIMADRFALNVRAIRHQRCLPLKTVGARCNLSAQTISDIERGRRKVTLEAAIDISKGLKVDLNKMITVDYFDPGGDRVELND